jgi:hypothetical protein
MIGRKDAVGYSTLTYPLESKGTGRQPCARFELCSLHQAWNLGHESNVRRSLLPIA